MTQIRHDRPILRYLDNMRREYQRDDIYNIYSAAPKNKIDKKSPRRLKKDLNERAYSAHMDSFIRISETSQAAIGIMLDRANDLLNARIEHIKAIGARKNVSKYEALSKSAQNALMAACAEYNAVCNHEVRGGKSPAREWFAKLRVIMGKEWEAFEEMDEFIKETSRSSIS
ncbi:MAG: hypothetical protein KGJ57_22920 [Sphingomonadales bacterium]|nr:hypothetical protein [Sphingomonadales bacterium]MDE2172239.1 hypothetical protein [Sphingomonadales bacterium]